MNRIISLVFLSTGTVLIIYSLNALDSISSSFSRFFTGTPTDQTMWFLIAGVFCLCTGVGGLVFGPKPTWIRS